MTTVPPLLSFVIPVRNDAERLRRCLESIRAGAADAAFETIVGDNGSTDQSAMVARAAGARVIDLPGRSVAVVRNLAAREAAGELLAFVDADHEIAAGWWPAARRIFTDPAVAAAGALCHAPDPGTWVQRMYDRLRRHAPGARRVEWLGSGNLVVRRVVFQRLGGFDPSLETCEDVDLCRRLGQSGGFIVADSAMRSVHHGDPPTLRALFVGELWRGRDNLRVSLRGPLTLRSLPGTAFPVVNLLALAVTAIGLVTVMRGGGWLVAGGVATLALLIAARAASLLHGAAVTTAAAEALPALAFASVYEAARALALVSRVGHAARRRH